MKKIQKRRFLDFVFKIFFKTPHSNPLPASGERGLEGVFLLLQEKIYESFYFNLKIFKFYISTYFSKKIIVLIPSPRLRGEGQGEGLFALKNSLNGYFQQVSRNQKQPKRLFLARNGIRSASDAIPGASRLRNQNEIFN